MILNRRELVAGGVAALGLVGNARAAARPRAMSNRSASAEAKALYRYLWSIYGRKTLTPFIFTNGTPLM